jgi:hypothetical protein
MGQMIDVRPDLIVDSLSGMDVQFSLVDFLPTTLVLVGAIVVPLIYKFKLVSIL